MAKPAVLLSVFLLCAGVALPAQGISWRTDVTRAVDEAKRTGNVLMIDVYTEWCGWCKRLDEETYRDAAVIRLSRGFVSLKIDAENNRDGAVFIGKYHVTGYPTILFVEPDGSLVNRVGGFLPADAFAARMRDTLEYREKVRTYLAEFRSGRYEHAGALLSMLNDLGRMEEAIPVFDRISAGSVLSEEERGRYALSIASSLIDSDQYERALGYIRSVETVTPVSDSTWRAYLYHSFVLFYTAGKDRAVEYLEARLQAPGIPAAWKARYRDLQDQMRTAE